MFALVVMWACGPAGAETPQATLEALFKPLPHAVTQVSACVMELPAGRVHLDLNADRVLVPASTHKVVSSAVALDVLGGNYAFKTTLYFNGPDLVVIGGGDPAIGDERLCKRYERARLATLETWADAVRKQGRDEVGDLIIDDRCFEDIRVHPAWEADDLPKWYAAPVGGVNFNTNCIDVTVWPRDGQTPGYSVFPPTDWITIENQTKRGSGTPWLHRPSNDAVYELRGRCAKRQTIQPVSVSDPALLFGHALAMVLESRGVTVRGTVRRPRGSGPDPAAHELVAVHRTPITDVLIRTLQNSQNLFAECLLKQAARSANPTAPGSWGGGASLMNQRLKAWNIPLDGAVFSDGSGLSRDNRLSARQLVEVLKYVYLDRELGDLFISQMASNVGPVPTVRKRFLDIPGGVWLKTGYMTGIKSLCGYVATNDGRWWAFAVIFNDIPGENRLYNTLMVNLCRTLAQQPGAPRRPH